MVKGSSLQNKRQESRQLTVLHKVTIRNHKIPALDQGQILGDQIQTDTDKVQLLKDTKHTTQHLLMQILLTKFQLTCMRTLKRPTQEERKSTMLMAPKEHTVGDHLEEQTPINTKPKFIIQ